MIAVTNRIFHWLKKLRSLKKNDLRKREHLQRAFQRQTKDFLFNGTNSNAPAVAKSRTRKTCAGDRRAQRLKAGFSPSRGVYGTFFCPRRKTGDENKNKTGCHPLWGSCKHRGFVPRLRVGVAGLLKRR